MAERQSAAWWQPARPVPGIGSNLAFGLAKDRLTAGSPTAGGVAIASSYWSALCSIVSSCPTPQAVRLRCRVVWRPSFARVNKIPALLTQRPRLMHEWRGLGLGPGAWRRPYLRPLSRLGQHPGRLASGKQRPPCPCAACTTCTAPPGCPLRTAGGPLRTRCGRGGDRPSCWAGWEVEESGGGSALISPPPPVSLGSIISSGCIGDQSQSQSQRHLSTPSREPPSAGQPEFS